MVLLYYDKWKLTLLKMHLVQSLLLNHIVLLNKRHKTVQEKVLLVKTVIVGVQFTMVSTEYVQVIFEAVI